MAFVGLTAAHSSGSGDDDARQGMMNSVNGNGMMQMMNMMSDSGTENHMAACERMMAGMTDEELQDHMNMMRAME